MHPAAPSSATSRPRLRRLPGHVRRDHPGAHDRRVRRPTRCAVPSSRSGSSSRTPFCHWVWGGGWMAEWGIKDFAGNVVHTTAGFSALAAVHVLGSRAKIEGSDPDNTPHKIPFAGSHRPPLVRLVRPTRLALVDGWRRVRRRQLGDRRLDRPLGGSSSSGSASASRRWSGSGRRDRGPRHHHPVRGLRPAVGRLRHRHRRPLLLRLVRAEEQSVVTPPRAAAASALCVPRRPARPAQANEPRLRPRQALDVWGVHGARHRLDPHRRVGRRRRRGVASGELGKQLAATSSARRTRTSSPSSSSS